MANSSPVYKDRKTEKKTEKNLTGFTLELTTEETVALHTALFSKIHFTDCEEICRIVNELHKCVSIIDTEIRNNLNCIYKVKRSECCGKLVSIRKDKE